VGFTNRKARTDSCFLYHARVKSWLLVLEGNPKNSAAPSIVHAPREGCPVRPELGTRGSQGEPVRDQTRNWSRTSRGVYLQEVTLPRPPRATSPRQPHVGRRAGESSSGPRQELLEVLLGRRRERMEFGFPPFSVVLVEAVEKERMQVWI